MTKVLQRHRHRVERYLQLGGGGDQQAAEDDQRPVSHQAGALGVLRGPECVGEAGNGGGGVRHRTAPRVVTVRVVHGGNVGDGY